MQRGPLHAHAVGAHIIRLHKTTTEQTGSYPQQICSGWDTTSWSAAGRKLGHHQTAQQRLKSLISTVHASCDFTDLSKMLVSHLSVCFIQYSLSIQTMGPSSGAKLCLLD